MPENQRQIFFGSACNSSNLCVVCNATTVAMFGYLNLFMMDKTNNIIL